MLIKCLFKMIQNLNNQNNQMNNSNKNNLFNLIKFNNNQLCSNNHNQ